MRLLTDVEEFKTPQKIAERLSIPNEQVLQALDFLVQHGLCVKKNNAYQMGIQSTHLESDSPWIYSRQLQWRVKSQQAMLYKIKIIYFTQARWFYL